MRHLRLLLLAAALVFSQLGGLMHGLSHQDQDRPHAACQLCAAYAGLDHASVGKMAPPAGGQAFAPPPATASLAAGRHSSLPYRARAPPGRA